MLRNYFRKDFREIFLFLVIILVSIPRRFLFPIHGLFAFNYDQGRDFLAVSKIIENKDIVLIGQTTGIPGVFYGPWWYYFLTPILFLTNGDPQKVAVVFLIIGILTVGLIFLLLKIITKNIYLAFGVSFLTAFSQSWMLGSTNIWNPTLTPIFIMGLIYTIHKIFQNPNKIYYFLTGIFAALAADTTASFGVVLILSVLLLPLLYRKNFFKKEFLFVPLGILVIFAPRILFELKNNFLMTKALLRFFQTTPAFPNPPLSDRFSDRAVQLINLFSSVFTDGRINLSILFISIFIIIGLIGFFTNKKEFFRDKLLFYVLLLLFSTFIFFVIYPQSVWEYYLVALPALWLILLAKVFSHLSTFPQKVIGTSLIIILIVINFQRSYLPPYNIDWEGDSGTYKNSKEVIDHLASESPKNYSLYNFSPARFDYPMDYLMSWYIKNGKIKKPEDNRKIMYLTIRDASKKTDFLKDWYFDKTNEDDKLIYRKVFPGDIVLEKYERP